MVTRLIFCRTVYTVETETETMFCCWSGGIQIFKGMFQLVQSLYYYSIETMYLVRLLRYSASKNGVTFKLYKCKKLQFIHKLTSSDTSKTAKITKR